MTKNLLILSFLILLSPNLLAQKFKSEADYIQKVYTKDKKSLMGDYLKLSDAEAEKFWPLFDQYEKERAQMGEERYKGLVEYTKTYKSATDEQCSDWIDRVFIFRSKYMTHLQEYTRRIEAQVGAKRAMQFYELEVYFRSDIRDRIFSEMAFFEDN